MRRVRSRGGGISRRETDEEGPPDPTRKFPDEKSRRRDSQPDEEAPTRRIIVRNTYFGSEPVRRVLDEFKTTINQYTIVHLLVYYIATKYGAEIGLRCVARADFVHCRHDFRRGKWCVFPGEACYTYI